MSTHLKSKQLYICIEELGAELSSVKDASGLEFIWQADKDIWPRHAPVLFPIIGKLKDNQYTYRNCSYVMSQHGFARDKYFKLIQYTEDSCVFELRSAGETKNNYPFDFVFQIHYHLDENTLHTEYTVSNPSEENIYFSVGAHPAFTCPLLKGETFEDYYLQFESSKYTIAELNNGLRKQNKIELNFIDNKLPLSANLFDNDALVFEDSQISKITLASKSSEHSITLQCKNWPYFGIWSKKGSKKFLCLEPWYGIADIENGSPDFLQKEGIIELGTKMEFNCSFSITFK